MCKPISTYRLQLNKSFGFEALKNILNYLKTLGVSDLYLSPISSAERGSLHGYNVINPNKINPELGGELKFKALCKILKKKNLGILLDIVPNHMASTNYNNWWQDVIKKKQKSKYRYLFDVTDFNSLSYRRFFDINELICMRVEEKKVFDFTHTLIKKLIEKEQIQGLRVDHVDGLRRPFEYLKNLKKLAEKPFYTVTEKILGFDEKLPSNWSLFGTTGYDFLNKLNQVFVFPEGLKAMEQSYHRGIKNKKRMKEIRYEQNKKVIKMLFSKEFETLSKKLYLLNKNSNGSFVQYADLNDSLLEVSACMPVYRTYIDKKPINDQDKAVIKIAFKEAKARNPNLSKKSLAFLYKVLESPFFKPYYEWVLNWQVFTGPMMAKGFEDTACYRYSVLLSLNEVGSGPDYFDASGNINLFHDYNNYQKQYWPYSMITTSTHDTKRGEDARARLNVLTEIHEEWHILLHQWIQWNQKHKVKAKGLLAPGFDMELMIYQTLVSFWPLEKKINLLNIKKRIHLFIEKASREAKVYTSWAEPNIHYEKALHDFVENILENNTKNKFLHSFLKFQRKISFYGMLNSLSQTILKMTSPGVSDIYQGTELFCFDLVDPDNRRSIDYEKRVALLQKIKQKEEKNPLSLIGNLMNAWENGGIKLYCIYKCLNMRLQHPNLFLEGDYIPLKVLGKKSKHIIAFLRQYKNKWVLTVVPRWFTKLSELNEFPKEQSIWGNTRILLPFDAPKKWTSILTSEALTIDNNKKQAYFKVSTLFQTFPFGICISY